MKIVVSVIVAIMGNFSVTEEYRFREALAFCEGFWYGQRGLIPQYTFGVIDPSIPTVEKLEENHGRHKLPWLKLQPTFIYAKADLYVPGTKGRGATYPEDQYGYVTVPGVLTPIWRELIQDQDPRDTYLAYWLKALLHELGHLTLAVAGCEDWVDFIHEDPRLKFLA